MRVYFYCREDPNAYQDDVVVLAEGLSALGIATFGNTNYWRRSPTGNDWLVRHDPQIRPDACDVVVVSYGWSRWIDNSFKSYARPLPEGLFTPTRKYRTAYLDLEDGYATASWQPEYRAFDVVLRAKYNRRCFHPGNHRPWVLGYSHRVLDALRNAQPWAAREPDLLVNFYASHSYVHPARALMERKFTPAAAAIFRINRTRDNLTEVPSDPYQRLMWEQTQHRHSQAYYDRLGRAQSVAAFCGGLIPPRPFAPSYLVGGRKAKLRRFAYEALARFDSQPRRLIQWDSWRFWESLAAGCVVFNFDLPHFGVELPTMPENFVHYIGVRPDNVGEVIARLRAQPALLPRIAEQGRTWVLRHYSPEALARRFLSEVGLGIGGAAG